MVSRGIIENAIRKNLAWFTASGIMDPADGSWGVAERIVRFEGNEAADKIRESFPVMTEHGGYAVLEHRRPDCNFETALLFLLAGEYFSDRSYTGTGENILRYLFDRSGLLCNGLWNWHSAVNGREFWFDDNGWNSAIQTVIGMRFPKLDRRSKVIELGRKSAEKLQAGLARCMTSSAPLEHGRWPDPERCFFGEPRQPHWGAPAAVALILSGRGDAAEEYFRQVAPSLEKQSASEHAYALLAVSIAAQIDGRRFFREEAKRLLVRLCTMADPYRGTLPSEHCEAPGGKGIADLIYTDNWFFTALVFHPGNGMFTKLLDTILAIQDDSDDPAFRGCWRGMYDFFTGTWGGGDRYEGGANSIYSGWTNAVIALALLWTLMKGGKA